MNYTVNQLAKLSGVTVRALRFYDEIGLLRPAFVAESGYRYYQEKELLVLQKILFFRELGFELKQIKAILKKSDFDRQAALQSHKKTLAEKIKHLKTLMVTIDKTINHIQGKQTMSEKELFYGLQNYSPKFQEFYRNFMAKASDEDKKHLDQMYEYEKSMTENDKQKLTQEKRAFWKSVEDVFHKKLVVDDPEVQRVMSKYLAILKHGNGLQLTKKQLLQSAEFMRKMPEQFKKSAAEFPELAPQYAERIKQFDKNPGMAEFLANAMKLYVERNFS